MKTEITMSSTISDQPGFWQDRVLLDEDFYRALREHPVPVSVAALRAIGPRSMVLDIYIWLAYRLHALTKEADVSWASLHTQFGSGFVRVRRFKEHFLESLALALAAYPDSRVDVSERGLTLRPSRPAIAKA